ncbi:hypothetical protein FE845_18420 [Marinobacter sp. 1-4A]|uniref:hypothetical protein n=1 Tax=Marinobacter sp. 1-4A TaxID=2582919 RepID=UPI0019065F9C|nr:hypothetical protein [Marinobacter sp. 1-4A]MBK1853322.1 hypothetical protein [Marinobacter sp. 1-4A]
MNRALKYSLIGLAVLLACVLALLFHLAAGPTIVEEYFNHEAPDDLDFSFSYCSADSQDADDTSKIVWQEDVAIVDVTLSPNCGTSWIFGNYKVLESGKLVLGYKSIVPSIIGCDCGYPATYRIAGLEKRDYEIELREYAFINRTPWLVRSWVETGPDIVETEEF